MQSLIIQADKHRQSMQLDCHSYHCNKHQLSNDAFLCIKIAAAAAAKAVLHKIYERHTAATSQHMCLRCVADLTADESVQPQGESIVPGLHPACLLNLHAHQATNKILFGLHCCSP